MINLNRRDALRATAGLALAAPLAALPNRSHAQQDGEPGDWAARKRTARVRGLDMAYYEAGRGDPIVFLHGNATSSYLWRNVIPHVRHLGRCIAPDMAGMGDSDPLPDSGPGRYTFEVHRDYFFELLDGIGVARDAVLVLHDWGSGVGFSWAQHHTDRVKGIAYMEAILRPPNLPSPPEPTAGPFATFRSPAGERAVLEENVFVEQLLIDGLSPTLTRLATMS
jgi:haloalkane dehalogenase